MIIYSFPGETKLKKLVYQFCIKNLSRICKIDQNYLGSFSSGIKNTYDSKINLGEFLGIQCSRHGIK